LAYRLLIWVLTVSGETDRASVRQLKVTKHQG
jgi:hypothetical protein